MTCAPYMRMPGCTTHPCQAHCNDPPHGIRYVQGTRPWSAIAAARAAVTRLTRVMLRYSWSHSSCLREGSIAATTSSCGSSPACSVMMWGRQCVMIEAKPWVGASLRWVGRHNAGEQTWRRVSGMVTFCCTTKPPLTEHDHECQHGVSGDVGEDKHPCMRCCLVMHTTSQGSPTWVIHRSSGATNPCCSSPAT